MRIADTSWSNQSSVIRGALYYIIVRTSSLFVIFLSCGVLSSSISFFYENLILLFRTWIDCIVPSLNTHHIIHTRMFASAMPVGINSRAMTTNSVTKVMEFLVAMVTEDLDDLPLCTCPVGPTDECHIEYNMKYLDIGDCRAWYANKADRKSVV